MHAEVVLGAVQVAAKILVDALLNKRWRWGPPVCLPITCKARKGGTALSG